MKVDFNQKELSCIHTALRSWIKDYYKENSLAWREKMILLEKVDKLLKLSSDANDFEWVCNECNFPNFTSSVSEDEIELELHACINCGAFEFHKRPIKPKK